MHTCGFYKKKAEHIFFFKGILLYSATEIVRSVIQKTYRLRCLNRIFRKALYNTFHILLNKISSLQCPYSKNFASILLSEWKLMKFLFFLQIHDLSLILGTDEFSCWLKIYLHLHSTNISEKWKGGSITGYFCAFKLIIMKKNIMNMIESYNNHIKWISIAT